MQCPYCHTELPDNAKFCHECGKKIGCPNCGYVGIKIGMKFCPECGANLNSESAVVPIQNDNIYETIDADELKNTNTPN